MQTLTRGEFVISGFRNQDLRRHRTEKSPGPRSAILKRLRNHGLLRRIGRTYKYYRTSFDRHAVLTAFKVKELVVIPALAAASAATA